jgi:hypothetical protein
MFTPGDGDRVLRFTNFETSSGPDVVVYLIAASNANDSDSVKNATPILLGSLRGNKGAQTMRYRPTLTSTNISPSRFSAADSMSILRLRH